MYCINNARFAFTINFVSTLPLDNFTKKYNLLAKIGVQEWEYGRYSIILIEMF